MKDSDKDGISMDNNITLPAEVILLIEFLQPQDFYMVSFTGNDYEVLAKDDVGNFIGTAPNGQVFYLETSYEQTLNQVRYLALNTDTFIKELNLYKKHSQEYELPENPSDKELEKYICQFKKQIKELDPNAFKDETTFWSVIAEQMETEQL